MKLPLKFMLAALVIAMLLPFTLLKDDEGKTLMSFSSFSLSDIKMPDMPSLPDMSSSKQLVPSVEGLGAPDIVYRWNDSEGNIHFTSDPPADGIAFTLKGYDPNANVIQAVKPPVVESPEPSIATDTAAAGEPNSPQDIGNTYTKDEIQNLFEKTDNIQQLLNQRFKNQNSAINQ